MSQDGTAIELTNQPTKTYKHPPEVRAYLADAKRKLRAKKKQQEQNAPCKT